MKKRIQRGSVLLLTGALLTLLACSRSDEQSGGAPQGAATVLSEPLLKLLPAEPFGFYAFNFESDAAKKWQAQVKDEQSVSAALEKAAANNEKLASASRLATFLKNEKIDTVSGGIARGVKGGIIIASKSTDPAKVVQLSVVLRAEDRFDSKSFLANLQKFATDEGAAPQPLELANGEGFRGEIKGGDQPVPFFGARNKAGDRIVLGVGDADPNTLLGDLPATDTAIPCPNFDKVKGSLPIDGGTVDFGCLNIPVISKVAAEQNPEDPSAKQLAEALNSVVFSRRISDAPMTVIAIDHQQPALAQAQGAKDITALLSGVPGETVLALAVDGSVLKAIFDSLPPEQTGGAVDEETLNKLKSIRQLALAVRPNPMAPFPDVLLRIDTGEDASKLRDILQQQAAGGLGMGDEGPQWQKETLEGVETQSLLTPFGVGLFIGSKDSVLMVGSSKDGLKALITGSGGSALAQTTAKAGKDVTSSSNSLGAVFLDFPKLAKTLEGVMGTVAMFSGGQSPMTPEALQELGRNGVRLAVASNKDSMLKIAITENIGPAVPQG